MKLKVEDLDFEAIEEKISEYLEEEELEFDDCFMGGVSEEVIRLVEQKLDVTFPVSYKLFLEKYGSGGIDGMTYWGTESNSDDIEQHTVVVITNKYREKGLPDSLVVFEDLGEYVVCLETSKMDENGECPVVTWSYHDNDGIAFCEDNFYTYFLNQIEDFI